jgi:hypothetical protein
MSATTPDGLISFKSYLVSGNGTKNTGQPPYTIKAKDLDDNFQRLVVKSHASKGGLILSDSTSRIPITRASDGKTVDTVIPITIGNDLHGQHISTHVLTLDLIIDGTFRQAVVCAELVPDY